ncbi:hypothetical protein SAY87_018735 [Trapa incisa]|uniref:DUF4378 domain-containing protein n=1 Tax=Trapa incisa TaxID=236973 RepID=A0AAN7K172_9MYRT|nr:hypothetical protein SAY87_018735 [Trapa incisa]
MAQKHLRELLSEEQEPFLLSSYIADRKSNLSRSTQARWLVKPPPPKSPPPFSAGGLCKGLFSISILPDSPDYRKPCIFDFASPQKSPNRIFLHVPAKTAALLLEAAVRIQERRAYTAKPKPAKKGILGSILKRLTLRSHREAPKRESDSERRIRRSFGSANPQLQGSALKKSTSPGRRCRGGHSRRSSGLWSETNGERSLDLDTSTSCSSDSIELAPGEQGDVYATFDQGFSGSPFRFVLRRSTSSSGVRTPDFPSPAASPARVGGKVETDCCDVESSKRRTSEEEDEEKEQCSPVSVLDPPFEDGHDHDHEVEEEDGFDCFAKVQRAKQKFLEKLRRFERLAGLDPVELEKRMIELDDEDGEGPGPLDDQHELVEQVLKWKFDSVKKIPSDMRRLVSDLVAEERGRRNGVAGVAVMRRVCDRFESWKTVDPNTIDMMVEEDLGRDLEGWRWKHDKDRVAEVASAMELAVFRVLVDELLEDLC